MAARSKTFTKYELKSKQIGVKIKETII